MANWASEAHEKRNENGQRRAGPRKMPVEMVMEMQIKIKISMICRTRSCVLKAERAKENWRKEQ